ncbi:unnamed protein product [Citrullus colocynthis]|uniref:Uncharacterized protein n=1 Tax=Citrullus colocynthis TaxID=252529 RepID=A0ABP0Y2M1_9ROSI
MFRWRKIEIQIQTQQITSLLFRTATINFTGISRSSAVPTAMASHVAAEGLAGNEVGATNGALMDLIFMIDQFEFVADAVPEIGLWSAAAAMAAFLWLDRWPPRA